MGEALVGNFAGRAMSFVARKDDLTNARVTASVPSKAGRTLTDAPTLIFRSDSNGEDLEGFAGAGLYDSIQMHEAELGRDRLLLDPMVSDEKFQRAAPPPSAHAATRSNARSGRRKISRDASPPTAALRRADAPAGVERTIEKGVARRRREVVGPTIWLWRPRDDAR